MAVKDVIFIFNEKLYSQTDGCAMGNPLGPTLANTFLCHHEKYWLQNCPDDFKPIMYKRYIDDTFVLFKEKEHVTLFLEYLNSQHSNIKFTFETEQNKKLNFLDVLVSKYQTGFTTSLYRKDTFTNLGMKFNSFIPHSFKSNLISGLITRAFKICSTETSFNSELYFLKSYFLKNNFPAKFINDSFKKTLQSFYNPSENLNYNVLGKPVYFELPHLGTHSETLKRQIQQVVRQFFPQLKMVFIGKSQGTIGSNFKFKDSIPLHLASSVIYKFSCSECPATYIGETTKQMAIRIAQHRGRSFRTDGPLSTINSSIYNHFEESDHCIKTENFKILATSNIFDLRTLESIYIHDQKPSLNDYNSSVVLNILR